MAVLVILSVIGWWLATVARSLFGLVGGPAPAAASDVLTLAAALAAIALLAWLALTVLLETFATIPGPWAAAAGRLSDRVTPAGSRRLARLLVGVTLTGTLAPSPTVAADEVARPTSVVTAPSAPAPAWSPTNGRPGGASTPIETPHPDASPADAAVTAPDPGWLPTRPTTRPQPSPDLLSRPGRTPSRGSSPGVLVVHRGDTLWDIAARHLGPEATDPEIAHAWPHWYAANREVIGSDPDLLLPGQQLQVPSAAAVT